METNEIRIKPSIFDRFKKEHIDIFNRLLNMLNIKIDDSTTHVISKNNIELKKDNIESLYDDIILYYGSSFYRTIKANKDNRYLSIFKQILKDNEVTITTKNCIKNN